jgi:DNA polymerase III delta prime subunit
MSLPDKYRPKCFADVIGVKQIEIVTKIKEMINSKDGLPNLFFYGPSGTGKTLLSELIAKELYGESKSAYYEFNASNDRGIDFIRGTISEIAKRAPLENDYRVILMDEADHITNDAQACFRRIIEQYAKTTRFIFTANFPYKLIDPLRSRFVSFEMSKVDQESLIYYISNICEKEEIKLTAPEIKAICAKSCGDVRRALNLVSGNMSDLDSLWENLSPKTFQHNTKEFMIESAMKQEPEYIFGQLWEMVKTNKAYKAISLMMDVDYKMNISVHKHLPVLFLIDKFHDNYAGK